MPRSGMASLEKATPAATPKSLAQRNHRQHVVLSVTKATMPGKMALALRREVAKLHEDIMKAEDPRDVVALVGAATTARNQLLDIIGWPKRPTPAPVKPGRLPAPVDITPAPIQDAQVASPESGI